MSDIIEKLGIVPIRIGYYESVDGTHELCIENIGAVRDLEKQRNEMLEALIDSVKFIEEISEYMDVSNLKHMKAKIKPIEKATGKTWEEIKELLG